jgi:hypothetical protein
MRNLTSLNPMAARVSLASHGGRLVAPRAVPALFLGLLIAAGPLVAPRAHAQQTPPPANPAHDSPSPADLEPGVNTSATPPPDSAPPPPAAPEVKSKPAAGSKRATVQSKPDTPPPAPGAEAKPASETRVAKATGAAKDAPAGGNKGSGKAQDHLQLDTTQITGNQELPKVLYIVPWKRSDLGDLLGKPANSLIDEVLQPVDRDVFRRENRYYDAVKPDANDNAGGATGQTSAQEH